MDCTISYPAVLKNTYKNQFWSTSSHQYQIKMHWTGVWKLTFTCTQLEEYDASIRLQPSLLKRDQLVIDGLDYSLLPLACLYLHSVHIWEWFKLLLIKNQYNCQNQDYFSLFSYWDYRKCIYYTENLRSTANIGCVASFLEKYYLQHKSLVFFNRRVRVNQ